MRRPSALQLLGITALVAGLALGACGSNDAGPSCGSGSPPDLSGEYHLAFYSVSGNAIPESTGDLHLGAPTSGSGNYTADLTIATQEIHDTGVYTLTGTSCIKQESTAGYGTTNGSYTREADTVTVTGTSTQANGTLLSRWVEDPI